MKQFVILSGKGGTGKTSLTAAFAHLAHQDAFRAVLADADVDAANLELVLDPRVLEEHDFIGGKLAVIDPEKCEGCGLCEQVCRFSAISERDGQYVVDPVGCDGCAACVYQCPSGAIRMESQLAGRWFRSDSRYGPLFHAALRPAQENSGKLVTLVKQQARLLAMDEQYPLVIVDGPPGIGCPVISAVSGADLALIVTEPTLASVMDMQRALEMTQHFHIPAAVCINKCDIYPEGTAQVLSYCAGQKIPVLGQISYDPNVTGAMVQGEPVTVYRPDSRASIEIRALWKNLAGILQSERVERALLDAAAQGAAGGTANHHPGLEKFSAVARKLIEKQENRGSLENPDARGGLRGWCGDSMQIDLRLAGEVILEARFETDGCNATIAAGGMVTRLATTLTLAEARLITPQEVISTLGGLPEDHQHCAQLAVNALRLALQNAAGVPKQEKMP